MVFPSFSLGCGFLLFSSPPPPFAFLLSCCVSPLPFLVLLSYCPQQIWLIHQLMHEPFLNVLALVTILCGTVTTYNVVDHTIQDLRHLQHLVSGKYWPLWTLNRFVHSWPRPMMMSWMPRHAMSHHPRVEERALFTYNVLLNTHRLESFTVYNLLYCISQHIWYTWDHYLPPSSMDIRWQDETGDTLALRNEHRLVDLLHELRPHWTEGQELGILFLNEVRPFTSHLQPYIMRMSCHEALPNRNMLP